MTPRHILKCRTIPDSVPERKYPRRLLVSGLIIGATLAGTGFMDQARAYGGLTIIGQDATPSPSHEPRGGEKYGSSHLSDRVSSSSFGRVPLWLAVQQILPASYKVSFGSDIDQNMSVSWRSGETIAHTLSEIAANNHLNYDVSGNRIAFTKGASTAPQIGSNADSLNKKQLVHAGGIQEKNNNTALPAKPATRKEVFATVDHTYGNRVGKKQSFPVTEHQLPSKPFSPADGGSGIYYAPANSNLASVIESWAARSGWSVVNETEDIYYPLMASASFKGTFTESVAAIINSFRGTSPYPRVTFYPNHVMRIFTSESAEE